MKSALPVGAEVEVNLFGPGHGECALVHLGGGSWIIIDSCLDSDTSQPAALKYLGEIGEDPASCVKAILVSHWHDDHIGGLATIVEQCPQALVVVGLAQTKKEFLAYLTAHDQRSPGNLSSGAQEYLRVLNILRTRPNMAHQRRIATSQKRVFRLDKKDSGHGFDCEIVTLSPSDGQVDKFLHELATLMPSEGETKRRAPAQSPNHLSVASVIRIGNLDLLFGADLEVTADPETGWTPILRDSDGRLSCFFKIPHHGSVTGHNDAVWTQLLTRHPLAAVTPFTRGPKKLPAPEDRARILSYTDAAFCTANPATASRPKKRSKSVERAIRETALNFRRAESRSGHIRLSCRNITDEPIWCIELRGTAIRLADIA